MYQDDMLDEGDGFKGKGPDPKVSVQTSHPPKKQQQQRFRMEMEQGDYDDIYDTPSNEHDDLAATTTHNHSELYKEDVPRRRQFELYDDDTRTNTTQSASQQHQPPSSQHRRASYARRVSSSGLSNDDIQEECAPPPEHAQRRRRSRSRSISPGGGRRRRSSQSRSISPEGRRRSLNSSMSNNDIHSQTTSSAPKRYQKRESSISSIENDSDDHYHLMPLEMADTKKNCPHRKNSKKSKKNKSMSPIQEAEEKYEAQIAFSLQMAFTFFCGILILAIVMAATMVANKGYFVVVLTFLFLLLSLAVGLCWFVFGILNEEESDLNNPNHQKHMPKWYRTVTKIIRDELKDFKDDWNAMRNDMLLLEGGNNRESENTASNGESDSEDDEFRDEEAVEVPSVKPRKRLGKSNLFRLVVSPAAALVNFRRKRKEKKAQKRAQARAIPFPSTV